MLRGLVALLRIVKEVRRIRQILELTHSKELQVYEAYKNYPKDKAKRIGDIIIDTSPFPKYDQYGQIIDDEGDEENG